MRKYWKRKWIAALRSRKYKQTTGVLRCQRGPRSFGYCCLGVLCDIHSRVTFDERDAALFQNQRHPYELPASFQQAMGISDANMSALVDMNDNGKTFLEIAHWIEENL